MNAVSLLQAVPAGNGLITIGMLVIMLLIMYFLIIRPQRKEQKKVQAMLDALKKGDKIVTIGGIHGTVAQLKERAVIIKVDEGCKIEMSRNAISNVVSDKAEDEPVESKAKEKTEKAEKNGKTETKQDA